MPLKRLRFLVTSVSPWSIAVAARNINQNIAVDQIGHVGVEGVASGAKIAPKLADIFDAVAKVGPVLPHAVKSETGNRRTLALEMHGAGGYANLNKTPLADLYILEGLENAIFILCSDGHRFASGAL
jgi:hypothetical protein